MHRRWAKIACLLWSLSACSSDPNPPKTMTHVEPSDASTTPPAKQDAMMISSPDAASAPDTIAVKSLAVGIYFACGLLLDDTITCWGAPLKTDKPPPTGLMFDRLEAGGNNLCGVLSDGTARCWGANVEGQSDNPEQTQFTYIDPGPGNQGCLVDIDGHLTCWGVTTPVSVSYEALACIRRGLWRCLSWD